MSSTIEEFDIDEWTPKTDRIYMGEGHRLPDFPSRQQLHYAAVVGIKHNGTRVKLPTRKEVKRRWTTAAAYKWFMNQLDTPTQKNALD